MKKYLSQTFNFIKRNALLIIFLNILLTLIAPWIFTRSSWFTWADFRETGQIGDTIGGITSPFINILNAILIYLAFTEQLNANQILQSQIDSEKNKEKERLNDVKDLIHFDLKYNILPSLDKIGSEIENYLNHDPSDGLRTFNNHVEFNEEIFKNINHSDLLKAFGNEFKIILEIYSRVKFIGEITPLNIANKYPTDRDTLKLINLDDKQYSRIKARHETKQKLILKSALNKPIPYCKHKIEMVLGIADPIEELF